MIELTEVNYKYPFTYFALKNINLKIGRGEIIAIVGNNGSGKSTLLQIIAGLIKCRQGKIVVDELEINKKTSNLQIREKVGMVFQNPDHQILFDNVFEDISFTLSNLKIDKTQHKKMVEDALKLVNMSKYMQSNPFNLSFGQKQRISIAGVLAYSPSVLLLDEPTAMLDEKAKEQVRKVIKSLKGKKTILFSTNILEEVLIADKVVLLEEGEIVSIIEQKDIIKNLEEFVKHKFNIPFKLKFMELLYKSGIKIETSEEKLLQQTKEFLK